MSLINRVPAEAPAWNEADHADMTVEHDDAEVAEANDEPLAAEQLYFLDLKKYPPLSADEELRLARLVKQGDAEARTSMIQCNLRLVVKLCTRYRYRGLALMDLVAEGNLGLIHAVEKFEPELGYRFSTYASWWIREAIERALMSNRSIVHIPHYVTKRINHYRRVERELRQRLGHEVSYQQLAEFLNEPLEQVREMLSVNGDAVSIDDESNEQHKYAYELPSDESVQPETRLFDSEIIVLLNSCLGQLTEREREVLTRRYGLNGHENATLEEVGRVIGLNRERVRQIQNMALQRMQALIAGPATGNAA